MRLPSPITWAFLGTAHCLFQQPGRASLEAAPLAAVPGSSRFGSRRALTLTATLTNLAVLLPPVFALPSLPKVVQYKVGVIIPQIYQQIFEKTHPSLLLELQAIAFEFGISFSATQYAAENNYIVSFEIQQVSAPEYEALLPPSICTLATIDQIKFALDYTDERFPGENTILLLPCFSQTMFPLFQQMGIEIPLITSRYNTQCNVRAAIFFEETSPNLKSAFSNALLHIMGADDTATVSSSESPNGNNGVKLTLGVDNRVAEQVIQKKCFINQYKNNAGGGLLAKPKL